MKKLTISFMIFMSLTVFTHNVSGQAFFIGPQLGYSAQKPSLTDIEFSLDTTFLYGLRAGMKAWMFAVEVNYFQAAHNLELKELVTFSWGGKQVDYNYIGLNGKLFFPLAFFHPYVTFGYGYYTADIFEIDKDTNDGYNFGFGVELQIGKHFSLLADGRYHRITVEIEETEFKLENYTLSTGFNFYF